MAHINWMDLYIRDWKSTSKYCKFWHIEILDKKSKLKWKAPSLKRDFRKISKRKFRVNQVLHNKIQL
jgi:hypothetical protein